MSRYITIPITEFLCDVDDDDIVREFKNRKLKLDGPAEETDMDVVREAHNELMRNRPLEARAILERILFPKWKSRAKCLAEYKNVER